MQPGSAAPFRLVTAVLLAGLAACGGGGGGGGTVGGGGGGGGGGGNSEFLNNWGLAKIDVANVYTAGYTGTGQIVAVIDTGIRTTHTDLNANIHADSIDIVVPAAALADSIGHGTAVAGVIAAEKNAAGMHGVAYNASLLVIRADELGPCFPSTCGFRDVDLTAGLDHARTKGAGVINMSLGGGGPGTAAFQTALKAATDAGIIVVISAGNGGTADPEWPALHAANPTYGGLIIAVGSTGATDQISSFSERAGAAANNYVVAPGESIYTTSRTGGYTTVSGTSFSAPHVSGAIALLKQRFPALTSAQIVNLLFTTATDLGATGTDTVYGRGRIDLDAALAPLGFLSIPWDDDAEADRLQRTLLALGPAFGDGAATNPALAIAWTTDTWDRQFPVDLRGRVVTAQQSDAPRLEAFAAPPSGQLQSNFGGDLSLRMQLRPDDSRPWDDPNRARDSDLEAISLTTTTGGGGAVRMYRGDGAAAPAAAGFGAGPLALPQLGLLAPGDGVAWHGALGDEMRLSLSLHRAAPVDGNGGGQLGQAWMSRAIGGGSLAVGVGALTENQALLRSAASGGFRPFDRTRSRFVTVAGIAPVAAGWEAFGAVTRATARPRVDSGLLTGWSRVDASAIAVGARKSGLFAAGDRMQVAFGQPLRVDRASANLNIATAMRNDGSLVFESNRVSLAPTGRELDLELSYDRPLGTGASIAAFAGTRRQPGHQRDAAAAAFGGLRLRVQF